MGIFEMRKTAIPATIMTFATLKTAVSIGPRDTFMKSTTIPPFSRRRSSGT
jgi:hypothetical protein